MRLRSRWDVLGSFQSRGKSSASFKICCRCWSVNLMLIVLRRPRSYSSFVWARTLSFSFQSVSKLSADQPIVKRVHPHVAQPGLIGFILRPFDLLTAKLIGFLQTNFSSSPLHCQCTNSKRFFGVTPFPRRPLQQPDPPRVRGMVWQAFFSPIEVGSAGRCKRELLPLFVFNVVNGTPSVARIGRRARCLAARRGLRGQGALLDEARAPARY